MFKIGNRVKITDATNNERYFRIGDLGTIVAINPNDYSVKFDIQRNSTDDTWYVEPDKMKLVSDMEEVKINCRCKDCKYSEKKRESFYCYFWDYQKNMEPNIVEEYGFCSNGEIKEN